MIGFFLYLVAWIVIAIAVTRGLVAYGKDWKVDDALGIGLMLGMVWPISIGLAALLVPITIVTYYGSTGKLPWHK